MATRTYLVIVEVYTGIFILKKPMPMEASIIETFSIPDVGDVDLWEAKIDTPGQSPDIPIYGYGFSSDDAFDELESLVLRSFDRHDNYHQSWKRGRCNSRLNSLNQYIRRVR